MDLVVVYMLLVVFFDFDMILYDFLVVIYDFECAQSYDAKYAHSYDYEFERLYLFQCTAKFSGCAAFPGYHDFPKCPLTPDLFQSL